MRRVLLIASVAIVLIGGSTYAWMGRSAEKTSVAAQDSPRVETASLFAVRHDISPAPASDLIAIKLATQPVIWPDVPKPAVKQKPSKPVAKKQAQKPKPKKPPAVTGSL